MAESHHFAGGSPGRQGRPRKGPASAPRGRRDYPVAQPYAPPPGAPKLNRRAHAARPPVRPPSTPSSLLRAALMVSLMAGIVVGGLGAVGWFYFKGPGRDMLREVGESLTRGKRPAPPPTLLADNSKGRPADPEADKPVVPPAEKAPPKERPAPEPDRNPVPAPPKEEPARAAVTFEKHILPIFEAKCVNCHGDKKRGGLDVRTAAALLKGGDNGPSVMPGSLEASPLWEAVQSNRMPPTPNKVNDAEKKLIQQWIVGGAK